MKRGLNQSFRDWRQGFPKYNKHRPKRKNNHFRNGFDEVDCSYDERGRRIVFRVSDMGSHLGYLRGLERDRNGN